MENTLRPTVKAALVLIIIAAAGLWAGSFLMSLFPQSGDSLQALIYYIPFILLPSLCYALRRRGLSEALRLNPMALMPSIMAMLLAVMCVYAASVIGSLWASLLNAIGLTEPVSSLASSKATLTELLIASAAIPAVCEELLIRGVALSAFESRGTRFGIWASAALFALMHGNIFGFPAYFLVGVAAGYVVYATNSLYTGMVFHTAYNATIIAITRMADRIPEAELEAASAAISPLSLLIDLLMVGLMIVALIMTLNLRRKAAGIQPIPRTRQPLKKSEKWLLLATLLLLIFNTIAIQLMA